MKNILVTGGLGYIGSHCVVELFEAGYRPIIFDNLSNCREQTLARLEQICGSRLDFIIGDIRRESDLQEVFGRFPVDAVMHFAGLKAVAESVEMPLAYFDNNISGSLNLLRAMSKAGVKQFVFSSSATVYGAPRSLPLAETSPLGSPTNPYGRSKAIMEQVLGDLSASDNEWSIACLRYFNPIGAHESGLIGEDPLGVPSNLLPYICQTALGARDYVQVYGGDYDTVDGTGVRDYIHVVDLAHGHLKAMEYGMATRGMHTLNLGTGRGYSVLEVIELFSEVAGRAVDYRIVERRPGDVASCYADSRAAKTLLNWEAKKSLREMCEDTWRWQQMNPNGVNSGA